MSTSPTPPTRLDKAPYEESNDVVDKYELEGFAEDGSDNLRSLGSSYTRNDQKDMQRMGKKQELRRMFRFLSIFSFTILIQCTWEITIIANFQGLMNGGMAGMFWSYIWTYAGFIFIVFSLAEMASMAPTSGGQYHWVSEFAPRRYQKQLSYFTGWMATMSWQAGVAGGSFLVGTIAQMLISLHRSSYEPQGWQGTLFVFAVSVILFTVNTWGARALPFFQNILLVLHIFGFVAVVIILWVVARVQSAEAVFTQFENNAGWSSIGLSLMVGQVNSAYYAICSDSAAHMSEEVKDAGLAVPRAMVSSFVVNGMLGLVMLVSFLFCIPNVADAVTSSGGYPFLYVLPLSMSAGAVTGITVLMLVLLLSAAIDSDASASRQTFAFARDHGLPASRWISYVHPKLHVPTNAIALTSAITMILSLINIGSSTAFNAIISLQLSSLMATYMCSIACVLYRRVKHPELLPEARWSLGRLGPVINGGGLIYSIYVFFWCFWPIATPTDATNFNWAVLMFVAVLILSGLTYVFTGRRHYVGPVTLVKERGAGLM